ncbi:DUF559 domain-containing protein [Longivirga aurantiaca]|uniref:DUF559 domain-containing protein n=1 Tax=Longivirga aurantiaca TaxID=1837743 RepID=A0ABW1T0P2_9ACTN
MTGRTHALDLVPGLRELARAQLGVVRRDQLRELGVGHQHVRRQVQAERWRAIGPHAVVLQTGALSRRQRLSLGAVHAGPGSELDLWSALEHAGLRGWERSAVHVAVPRGRRVARLDGVVVRQVSARPPAAVDGPWPPAAPQARAAVEAACLERTDTSAAGLLVAVAQQRVATPEAMRLELDRLWRPRRAPLLRAALYEAGAGSESVAEIDVLLLVRRAGLPEPRRQVLALTPDGVEKLDLVVDLPDGRTLVIEVDGPHHDDSSRRAGDAARDAALIALGYLVLHIPVIEIRTDPAGVVRRLRRIAQAARAG